jgi:hypothetical protein
MILTKRFYVAVLAACAASPTMAQSVCGFQACSATDASVEVPVVGAPCADARVLGVAPLYRLEGEEWPFGAEFTVTSVQDGWAAVTEVWDWNRKVTVPDGWIDS